MGYDDINKNILTSQIKGTVYTTHALVILVHVHEKNPYLQIHFSKTNIIIVISQKIAHWGKSKNHESRHLKPLLAQYTDVSKMGVPISATQSCTDKEKWCKPITWSIFGPSFPLCMRSINDLREGWEKRSRYWNWMHKASCHKEKIKTQ